MQDRFGRTIDYLRLSVTDRCNLRCRYCMPSCGVALKEHSQMLTQEEAVTAVRACAALGITKVRITGGEPLVKRDLINLCFGIAGVEGIETVALTTNATLLSADTARDLIRAGVSRINISLDTLDAEKYRMLTRTGDLKQALDGLDAALGAGFEKVKVNTVLMKGFNDDEIPALADLTRNLPIDLRFIELMPMIPASDIPGSFLEVDAVLRVLSDLLPEDSGDGVARMYRLSGARGRVGLISPLSAPFCASCNRIRITADGTVKPCLHSGEELAIKGLDEARMRDVIMRAIMDKPAGHELSPGGGMSTSGRSMNRIGG